ncbi:MAG: SDR family NAD(P)-dependent oxidoreductase [Steroidobacteraceae bacterium]
MDLGMRGRCCLIVGASRGVGSELAGLLAAEGALLVLLARDGDQLARVAATLPCPAADVLTIAADAAKPETMPEAVAAAIGRFGALHGLAVLAGKAGTRATFLETDDLLWEHHFHSTLMTSVRACRSAIPELVKQPSSAIVLTAAYSVRAPKPSLVAYTAMKSAVASVAKNIAKAHGADGLRCNAIAPGIIDRTADAGATGSRYEQVRREHGMQVALGRSGRPAEFAEAIAWLLSSRAGYVNGALLNVDGGTDF